LLCQAQVLKTRLKMAKGTRAWCFTLNNYTEEERDALRSLKCKYIVFGTSAVKKGPRICRGTFICQPENAVGDEEVSSRELTSSPVGVRLTGSGLL